MRFSVVTLLLLSLSLVSGGYTTNKPQPAVTQPPATAAPTVYVAPTEAPTLPAVTQPPATAAPTVYVYPTEEPTEKPDDDDDVVVIVNPPRPNPTQPPVVIVQPPRPNPTQPPTTVIIYPIYPVKCAGETPVCIQGGPLPTNCRQAWIQWDQCECKFWCNNTAAPVATNPTQTVIITNPTSQPTNTPVDTITITTNITKPSNNTRCIAGICITLNNAAAPSTFVSFPVVMAILLGLAALL